MSKTSLFGLLLLALCLPSVALAASRITAFSSHIEIASNGSARVQEEIIFDFGDEQLHGIYREIPLIFPASDLYGETQVELSSISVTDGRGNPRQTSYDKGGNIVTLKIGDYDKLVTGAQLYVIRYTVWGAFTPTLLKDRFQWDITGHNWKVPLDHVRADIVLPSPVSAGRLSFSCASGERGSVAPCTSSGPQVFATSGEVTMLRFEEGALDRFQGLSVKLELPKGVIFYEKPEQTHGTSDVRGTTIVKWWQRPFIDLSLAFPFFIFAGLYTVFLSGKEGRFSSARPGGAFSLRRTYLLAGFLVSCFSFFIPTWNIGVFTSGLVIGAFAFLYPRG